MKTLILISVFLFFSSSLFSQEYDKISIPVSLGSASQSVLISSSFNVLSNPALMTTHKKFEAGISAGNHYFIKELKYGGAGAYYRIDSNNAIGAAIVFDGTSHLRQSSYCLGYSKKLLKDFSAGLTFIYLNTFEESIGNKNNLIAKAGIAFKPSRNIAMGFTVYNPPGAKFKNIRKEELPTFACGALKFIVSKQVEFFVEDKLSWTRTQNLKLALHYEPRPGLKFFLGIQNTSSVLSFGFSYTTKNIKLSYAMEYHQQLGFSAVSGIEFWKE
jgi:hypothetical protein